MVEVYGGVRLAEGWVWEEACGGVDMGGLWTSLQLLSASLEVLTSQNQI